MTVRDFANDILDLQLWQGLLVWVLAAFAWGLGDAVARDVLSFGTRRRNLKGERGSSDLP